MPILHVRNVPDDLYQAIQARAVMDRRSLTAEVLALLELALAQGEGRARTAAALERLTKMREELEAEGYHSDAVAVIRKDRER